MSAVRRVAGRVIASLPDRLVGPLLPPALRYRGRDVPAPSTPPQTSVRLYIGPTNYAGQAGQWTRAVERHLPGVGATSVAVRAPDDFGHPADTIVPRGVWAASGRWGRTERDAVLAGFTHLVVEAGRPPFGGVLHDTAEAQIRAALAAGLRVAYLAHGSDVRLPSRHAAREPDSPFSAGLATVAPELERIALANRALVEVLGIPAFASTPDLLLDLPQAEWLPVVVDPASWRAEGPPMARRIPVVVHAPSRGAVKGSDLVDPVLRRLHGEGVVEYRRIEGVPYTEMPGTYRDADIVLDQFRLGDYGAAACEAMAAGRVVVGHVSEGARALVEERTGLPLPIVEATGASLESAVRRLVEDRRDARTWAERGAEFVREVHDGRRAAEVLRPFLLDRPGAGARL